MFKIVVGCYEQLVLGYTVTSKPSEDGDFTLQWESSFTDHSQEGCIKCLGSNDTFMASGSTDETIRLYDLKQSQELGSLQGHTGAINQVLIPDKQHLISCSDDGTIRVWDAANDGDLIKTLHGHKGPVTSFAIHPSGKLGMSLSMKEGTLRTWNMISGRSVYVKNIKKSQLEFIRWSPDGKYYVTASQRFVQIYELETAKCIHEWETKTVIMTLELLPVSKESGNVLVFGDNSGNINIHSLPDGACLSKYKAHENRVKCLHAFSPPKSSQRREGEIWLASVSSDGKIKVWRHHLTSMEESQDHKSGDCLLTIDTGARLTCVTTWQQREGDPPNHTQIDEIKEVTNIDVKTEDVNSRPKRGRKRKRKGGEAKETIVTSDQL